MWDGQEQFLPECQLFIFLHQKWVVATCCPPSRVGVKFKNKSKA